MGKMSLGFWEALHFSLMMTPLFMQVFALYNGSTLEWSKKSALKQLSSKEYLSNGVRKTYNIYHYLEYIRKPFLPALSSLTHLTMKDFRKQKELELEALVELEEEYDKKNREES